MDNPFTPDASANTASTKHSVAESSLQSQFESFARQERTEQELLRSLVSICTNEPHATWQALSLLDQYHRRGVLPTTYFRELKKELNAIAFGNAGTHVTVEGKTFARAQTARTANFSGTDYATASFATAAFETAFLRATDKTASRLKTVADKAALLDFDLSEDADKTSAQQSTAAALLNRPADTLLRGMQAAKANDVGKVERTKVDAAHIVPVVRDPTHFDPTRSEPTSIDPTHIDPTHVEPPHVERTHLEARVAPPAVEPLQPMPIKFDTFPQPPASPMPTLPIHPVPDIPPSDGVAPISVVHFEPVQIDSVQVNRPNARAGMVLIERYVLVEPITSGTISMVFKAFDQQRTALPELERYVAIKCPHTNLQKDPRTLAAFQHEYAQSQTILHPNIAKIYDLYEGRGQCFIVMELLQGEPLDRLLERIAPRRLPLPRALAIVREIGLALAHAHDHSVVHGNLQTSNVTLTRNGEIRVSDFAQSAGWLPPDAPKSQPSDDLYSLACIAHELLCGCVPEDKPPEQRPSYAKHLSAQQWRALQSGLAYDRTHRANHVKRWLTELDMRTAEIRLPALSVLESELAGHSAKQWRVPITVAATVCAIIAVGSIAIALRGAFKPPPTTSSPTTPSITAQSQPASNDPIAAAWTTASAVAPADVTTQSQANDAPTVAPVDTVDIAQLATVSFTADRYEVSEHDAVARIMVQRSDPANKKLQLRWFTIAGSAQPGVDYVGFQYASVQLQPGQKSAEISIPLIPGSRHERDVSFDVRISATGEALPGKSVVAKVIVLPAM